MDREKSVSADCQNQMIGIGSGAKKGDRDIPNPNTSVTLTFGFFLLQCLATHCAFVCSLGFKWTKGQSACQPGISFSRGHQVSFELCAWVEDVHPFCLIWHFFNFVPSYFSLKILLRQKRELCDSCVLVIVVYPVVRNCLRENLSILVLACCIKLLINSCFNLRWCTDKGRLVNLRDGWHCQGKMDLSDSLTSRQRLDAAQVLREMGFWCPKTLSCPINTSKSSLFQH